MSRLLPFRAGLYADPDSTVEVSESTLDISGVLRPGSAYIWAPDALAQPSQWVAAAADGAVIVENEPALYIVKMGWRDEEGRPHQVSGVVGVTSEAVGTLTQPTGIVVSDQAFGALLVPEGVPLVRATVADRHFRIWPCHRTGVIETIGDAVDRFAPSTTSPFVLASTERFTVPAGLLFCLSRSIEVPARHDSVG